MCLIAQLGKQRTKKKKKSKSELKVYAYMHNMHVESLHEWDVSLSERGFGNGGPGQAKWDTKGEELQGAAGAADIAV